MDKDGIQGSVVALPEIALNFPKLSSNVVDRPYILDTIENIFQQGIPIVVLDGEEEIGKTTLLAQFALRHHSDCFSLFIQPFSQLTSDVAQLRFDISNQIHWHLHGTTIEIEADVSPERLRNLVHVLQRRARRDRRHYYFVLDAFDSVTEQSTIGRDFVLANLPIGSPDFRFVFSSSRVITDGPLLSKYDKRIQTVSPLSMSETAELMRDLNLDSSQLTEFYKTFRGVPGRLAHAKRLALSGESVAELLEDGGSSPQQLFSKEWGLLLSEKRVISLAVAAVGFLPECRNLSWLENVVNESASELTAAFRRIRFVEVDDNTGLVTFASESYQRFARRKLSGCEQEVLALGSKALFSAPDSDQTIRLLPEMLIRAGQLNELTEFLTPARLASSLRGAKSLAPMLQVLGRAANAAKHAEHADLLCKVTLFRSVLRDYARVGILDDQVEAALATREQSLALSIANSAELSEQRLALLATIARDARQRGLVPESSLIEQILRVAATVDFAEIGDIALDIASDLLLVAPDIAAQALEGYAKTAKDANAIDQAIVALSFKAVRAARDGRSARDALMQVDKLAAGTSAEAFSRKVSTLFKTGDADAVLEEARGFTSTGEKVFFLRQWLSANARENCAIQVALGVSQIILADTGYAPSATVFRDLARPLQFAASSDETLRLISFLEGQSAYAKQRGPIVDYYRLRFSLGATRVKYEQADSVTILAGDALDIDDLKDAALRATCFAWLGRAVEESKLGEAYPDPFGLRDYAQGGMTSSVESLLTQSAEQLEGTRGTLSALCTMDARAAINLGMRLNTRDRRDGALIHIAQRIFRPRRSGMTVRDAFDLAQLMLEKASEAARQILTIEFIEWASTHAEQVLGDSAISEEYLRLVDGITDPDVRVRLSATFLGNVPETKTGDNTISRLYASLERDWREIEDDLTRVVAGYAAVTKMGKADLGRANRLTAEIERFARPKWGYLSSELPVRNLLLLQCRSLALLATVRSCTEGDIADLAKTAELIGSTLERARLLAIGSLFVFRANPGIGRKIVESLVIPVVAAVVQAGRTLTTEAQVMVMDASPALWVAHQSTAERMIAALDSDGKEVAYGRVFQFVLNQRIPTDAWHEESIVKGGLSEQTINDCLLVLEKVWDDSSFSLMAETLLGRLKDRTVSGRLSVTQRSHLVSTVRQLGRGRLPSKDGIQHQGYLIVLDARIFAIEQGKHDEWQDLIARATQIPNLSDSCFVLTIVGAEVPTRFRDLKRRCVDLAIDRWRNLPTFEERVLRLKSMVKEWGGDFRQEIRELVEECASSWRGTEGAAGARNAYRNLIEIAHGLDEEWAASLVSVTDDDPARIGERMRAREVLEHKKAERYVMTGNFEDPLGAPIEEISRACWAALGHLNANGHTGLEWNDAIRLVGVGSVGGVSECYPIVAFALAGLGVRYRGADNMRDRMRMLHGALLNSVGVLRDAGQGAIGRAGDSAAELLDRVAGGQQIVFSPNEREKALSRLGHWLEKVRPRILDIVDPYFRPSDIGLLALVQKNVPDCRIRVLTSRKAMAQINSNEYDEAFQAAWRTQGLVSEPPPTAIFIVGRLSDGECGIHDRWWLAESDGLLVGTSFNSIGVSQTSVIQELAPEQVAELKREVDPYFQLLKRLLQGEKLTYFTVTLP